MEQPNFAVHAPTFRVSCDEERVVLCLKSAVQKDEIYNPVVGSLWGQVFQSGCHRPAVLGVENESTDFSALLYTL